MYKEKRKIFVYFFWRLKFVQKFLPLFVCVWMSVSVMRDTWKKQVGLAAGTKHFFILPC